MKLDIGHSQNAFLVATFFALTIASADNVQAQSFHASAAPCRIKVRVIQGAMETDSGVSKISSSNKKKGGDTATGFIPSTSNEGDDAILPEMESQLKTLPFSNYKVLDSAERDLDFDEEGSFVVADGEAQLHNVTVTPDSADAQRVKMTVKWKGPDGKQLLASELKVANGKCLVLGTDSTKGDRSTILSIRAECAEGPE
jgi:hypothetical protein